MRARRNIFQVRRRPRVTIGEIELRKCIKFITNTLHSICAIDHRELLFDNYNNPNGVCGLADSYNDPHKHSQRSQLRDQGLKLLRDKLLKHKWGDAAVILNGMDSRVPLDPKFIKTVAQILWRVGNDILYNHPLAQTEDFISSRKCGTNKMGTSIDKTQLSIEFVFSLLSHQDYSKAKQELSNFTSANRSVVTLDTSYRDMEYWGDTAEAYLGLIEYVNWKLITVDEKSGIYDTSIENHQSLSLGAAGYFRKLLFVPGIWDTFILKHIEILLYYHKYDYLKADLTLYSELHLENPNAHKYLYQVLQAYIVENDDSVHQLKIAALRRLHEVSPADSLMINLHNLLFDDALSNCKKLKKFDVESQQFNDLVYAFEVLMDLLDYPCWSSSKQPWLLLSKSISRVSNKLKDNIVSSLMNKLWFESGRGSWWPAYYFTIMQAHAIVNDNDLELLQAKYGIASKFISSNCKFCKIVKKALP